VHSILLYGAPVWGDIVSQAKYKGLMEKAQRGVLLRICSGYRTVSTEALQVIGGVMPIELQVRYRVRTVGGNKEVAKLVKQELMQEWEDNWKKETGKAKWTKRLIVSVREWVERKHGEVDFHLCQFLSGHGCFGEYLVRIGKEEESRCWFCGLEDSVEHTIFVCVRWAEMRWAAECAVEEKVGVENIVGIMLSGSEKWDAIKRMVSGILVEKEKVERIREREGEGRRMVEIE
jgi:hypothetical protein